MLVPVVPFRGNIAHLYTITTISVATAKLLQQKHTYLCSENFKQCPSHPISSMSIVTYIVYSNWL